MPEPHQKRVLVIGDAMIDSYKTCGMERISPEAPVPVLNFREQYLRLGGAANLAAGIAAMGTDCDLFALAGEDAHKPTLSRMLTEAGVCDHILPIAGKSTILKERILAMSQQVCRIDYETRFSVADSNQLMAQAMKCIDRFELIVVSDYDKGCTQSLEIFMSEAERHGVPVLIDPKHSDWAIYAGAYLVKPNWKEFLTAIRQEKILPEPTSPHDHISVQSAARSLMERYRIKHLVVTAGADGYLHISKDELTTGATRAREIFDLSGAGDSFLAALTAFLAQGAPLDRAIELGNAAAGLAVGHLGTSVITRAELMEELVDQNEATSLNAIRRLANEGRRIVFTNGCFDILHTGHLSLLRQAKAAGDILVVGVNSDASVARLKGPTRPITPLEDRMAMLAGLKPVDFVLSFEEDVPQTLIERVAPDVLVKGGDYTRDTVVGADFVEALGGRVLIVPILDGRSTTNVVTKCTTL